MRIPELNLACGNDDLRPLFSYVCVDKEYIVATNAHILAYYETKDVFDKEFIEQFPDKKILIHREDWVKFKTSEQIEWHSKNSIKVHYAKKRPAIFEVEFEENIGNYTKWKSVVPVFQELESTPLAQIGINAEFMATLQKILRKGIGLKCTFYAPNKAIEVESVHLDETGKGLVMPVMIDKKWR